MIFAVFLFLAADTPKDDETKKEQEKLKGTWVVVSSEKSGKPHEDTKNAKFIFDGDELTVILKGDENKGKDGFRLNLSKKQKWIDSRLGRGIYELDGDGLRICSAEERPTEFVSKPKSNVYLYVLKREKP